MSINPRLGQTPYIQPSVPTTGTPLTDGKEPRHGLPSGGSSASSATTVPMDSSHLEKQEAARQYEARTSKALLAATEASPTVELREAKNGEEFHKAIAAAKDYGKLEKDSSGNDIPGKVNPKWRGAFVKTYSAEKYDEMKMLITTNGKDGGVAVKKSGDIVSVFKHPKSTVTNFIGIVLPKAIEKGGTHLDCFAGFLPTAYAEYGFIPVAKVKFDPGQQPDDWSPERNGAPDIIFMAYDQEATIEEDAKNRKVLVERSIAALTPSTYDEALAKQEAFVKEKNPSKT